MKLTDYLANDENPSPIGMTAQFERTTTRQGTITETGRLLQITPQGYATIQVNGIQEQSYYTPYHVPTQHVTLPTDHNNQPIPYQPRSLNQ